jgi:hypothetical protein
VLSEKRANWSGFCGRPNGEGVAIIWHHGVVPDQVRAPKGLAADCMLTAQSDVRKNLPEQPLDLCSKKTLFSDFLLGDIQTTERDFLLECSTSGTVVNFPQADFSSLIRPISSKPFLDVQAMCVVEEWSKSCRGCRKCSSSDTLY